MSSSNDYSGYSDIIELIVGRFGWQFHPILAQPVLR
jgi:hypothetical protein